MKLVGSVEGHWGTASLYADGTWSVVVAGSPAPAVAQALGRHYGLRDDGPAEGIPGTRQLRRIASVFGGKVRIAPHPAAGPGVTC